MARRRILWTSIVLLIAAAALGSGVYWRMTRIHGPAIGRAAAEIEIIDQERRPRAGLGIDVFYRKRPSRFPDAGGDARPVRFQTDANGRAEIPFFRDGLEFENAWLATGEMIGPRFGDGSGRTQVTAPAASGSRTVTIAFHDRRPLTRARVTLGEHDRIERRTDENGRVEIPVNPVADPDLVIMWTTDSGAVRIVLFRKARDLDRSSGPQTITLPPTSGLYGTIDMPDGLPSPALRVIAVRKDDDEPDDEASDDRRERFSAVATADVGRDGVFGFPALPRGRWTLEVQLPENAAFVPRAETIATGDAPEVEIKGPKDTFLSLPFVRAEAVTLKVVSRADRSAIAGLSIRTIFDGGIVRGFLDGTSNENGVLRTLRAAGDEGPLQVAIRTEPIEAFRAPEPPRIFSAPVEGANGAVIEVDLGTAREVKGIVADPDGRPVAGAIVRVTEVLGIVEQSMNIGTNAAVTRTEADGTFRTMIRFTGKRRFVARFGTLTGTLSDGWYGGEDGRPVTIRLQKDR